MSDDEKMGDILKPDFSAVRLEIKGKSFPGCRHNRIVVDPELRKIACKACGETLDPVQVLYQYAIKERQFQNSCDRMRDIAKRIGELKTEEKRIKSRIRYAKGRLDGQ